MVKKRMGQFTKEEARAIIKAIFRMDEHQLNVTLNAVKQELTERQKLKKVC